MTHQEKAKKLIEKFLNHTRDIHGTKYDYYEAKQCALICVGEIIKDNEPKGTFLKYWQEVKQEINKL